MEEQKIMLDCDFCNKSFSDEDMLSLHVMTIHRSIIEGQKTPFVRESETAVQGKKTFECQHCDKSYISSSHLCRHIRASHENELFDCTECGKKFKTNYELLRHGRNVHSSENKTFTSKC